MRAQLRGCQAIFRMSILKTFALAMNGAGVDSVSAWWSVCGCCGFLGDGGAGS